MPIYAVEDWAPTIDESAFVHPDAVIIGDVRIGPESSVWPGAVIRGDNGPIIIGSRTSIQDGTVIHTTWEWPTTIGDEVTVGHNVHLEGCRIGNRALIGSGSVVLHDAQVGDEALVGACALVGNRKVVPAHARALGVPAVISENVAHYDQWRVGVEIYVERAQQYRRTLRRLD